MSHVIIQASTADDTYLVSSQILDLEVPGNTSSFQSP